MELFVLDDGWFGKRNSDDSSLGIGMSMRKSFQGALKIWLRE